MLCKSKLRSCLLESARSQAVVLAQVPSMNGVSAETLCGNSTSTSERNEMWDPCVLCFLLPWFKCLVSCPCLSIVAFLQPFPRSSGVFFFFSKGKLIAVASWDLEGHGVGEERCFRCLHGDTSSKPICRKDTCVCNHRVPFCVRKLWKVTRFGISCRRSCGSGFTVCCANWCGLR